MKSRKVRLALAAHPRTPRRIALRLIRELYTFDLMQFSRLPTAPADLKRTADELLVSPHRLASRSANASHWPAAPPPWSPPPCLLDKESRVWQTALENPRLTETAIVQALLRPPRRQPSSKAICRHAKWSVRLEIRTALLRNEFTPHGPRHRIRSPPPARATSRHPAQLPPAGEDQGISEKDLKSRRLSS